MRLEQVADKCCMNAQNLDLKHLSCHVSVVNKETMRLTVEARTILESSFYREKFHCSDILIS
jgi:hypothetical protein